MSSTLDSFVLPDLLSMLPFKHSFNSTHYEPAMKESSAWVNSYDIVPEHKRAYFEHGDTELVCAHVYPYANFDELRTAMNLVDLLFVIDDVSDDQDGKGASETGQVFLSALRDPDWHDGSPLAQMTKELRERLLQFNVPACYNRLLKHCEDYINAVTVEAELRERNKVLDPEAYANVRKRRRLDLPDEMFEHPIMTRLHIAAVDMVWLANDPYSYNREQAMGHPGNNILTVLMESEHCDLQTAADLAGGARFKQIVDQFQADKALLPSWGPEMDAIVAEFVKALETWVVGNIVWSFETTRYFGDLGEEVKRTRVVQLYPKHEVDH
ncbi:terpenoid synthase [Rhodofomes roseus]|uniref:Terpene synthase n=1 Tax=Rhodofomes roseus TaxID=34475 RepID=A0ABQ8KK91_9APHY|nr:terpenoid synthase [Rhodofomes roseus]KAH9838516.1 terpenoid synthase [Rhodofomes roseus]